MRYCGGIINKERLVRVGFKKINGCIMNKIGAIGSCFSVIIIMKEDLLLIMPEMVRIIVMSKSLTVVTKKFVESLLIGISFSADKS